MNAWIVIEWVGAIELQSVYTIKQSNRFSAYVCVEENNVWRTLECTRFQWYERKNGVWRSDLLKKVNQAEQ